MTDLMTLGDLVHTDRGRPWLPGNEGARQLAVPVLRDGRSIDITAFVAAVKAFESHVEGGRGRTSSDNALARVVHSTLRLTRQEAADPGIWAWLASCAVDDYVRWRWMPQSSSDGGGIQPERWHGPIHKQALARLWWGMELFRDGPHYPASLFTIQDVPNSILHRSFVRNRPLAVAIHGAMENGIMAEGKSGERQLRQWFRAINLYGGSRDLAALGLYHRDDPAIVRRWVREEPRPEDVAGPPEPEVSADSRRRAEQFLQLVWDGRQDG